MKNRLKKKQRKPHKGKRRVRVASSVDRPLFGAEEQLIYRFKMNGKYRVVDPMRVAAKLANSDPPIEHLLKLMRLPTKDMPKAWVDAAAIIRDAFGLEEVGITEDGTVTGASDGFCIGLYVQFAEWTEEVKKKLPPSSIVWKSPEADGSPVEVSPTPNTSESGSTANGSCSAEPWQLP